MADKNGKRTQATFAPASEEIVLTEDGVPVHTLYLANIPQQKSEEILKNEFSRFGEVKSVVINRKRKNAKDDASIYRYGFVYFENAEAAATALKTFRKSNQEGISRRIMKVRAAHTWKQSFIAQNHSDSENLDCSAGRNGEQGMTIFDLNEDCLRLVFSYLNPVEGLSMSLAYVRFKNISKGVINANTVLNLNHMKYLTLMESRELLRQFGRYIKRIRLEEMYDKCDQHFKFIQKYCPDLEELSFIGNENHSINFEIYRRLLASSKKVKVIELEYCNVNDTICLQIATYSNLERLNLTHNWNVTGKHLNTFQNLVELNLKDCEAVESIDFIDICIRVKELKTLNIENCYQLNDSAFETIIRTQYKLERLIMSTFYEARNIHIVGCLMHLKHIGISYGEAGHNLANIILMEVAENRGAELESLTILYYNCCSPRDQINIEQIIAFPNLKKLVLYRDIYINGNYLIEIANNCSKLVDVNITQSGFTDETVLAAVSSLKQLRHFNVSFGANRFNTVLYYRILNIIRERNSIPLTLCVDDAYIERSFLQTEEYNKWKQLLTLTFNDIQWSL